MRKIDEICKETIIQGMENIIYRMKKYEKKKIKIIKKEDYSVIMLNLTIIREEIDKINNVGKYIITNEEQFKRYIESKKRKRLK